MRTPFEHLQASVKYSATLPGTIAWPTGRARCVFGRSGLIPAADKREGDGATPAGAWPMRRVWFRADQVASPSTALPVAIIPQDMGWCDEPTSPAYNQPVTLPFPHSHERMWREDRLYDLVVELGYNDDPVVAGAGSAIFLHVAAPECTPTEGCVATDLASLGALIASAQPGDRLHVFSAALP